ncbi:MAG: DUF2442 domain-containing protein [Lachnospiraceae bacterium]|nr:DUF2442 domain-containing protein [Lachnospiraceae bacterium]
MIPEIVQVVPTDNYEVYIYFEDGKIVCYDASGLLEKEVFSVLKDIQLFKDTCTILNDTLAWDIEGNRDETTCLDIDPYMLYGLEEANEKIA